MRRLLKIKVAGLIVTCLFYGVTSGQMANQKLAEKYNLKILPVDEVPEPAPDWLRQADMITSGRNCWKGYQLPDPF